ncbi:hypothetical protein [Methylobacterium sp. AMS5]|nr:hypothetical protein [Methylobacterium sp. AMS5]AMB48029.1 hypothetical protein Y590_23995 [Methylobacterium sp. AMS5]
MPHRSHRGLIDRPVRQAARPASGPRAATVGRIAAVLTALALPGTARAEPLASESPRIPEPMVFDLLRPLGARAGEREINVLTMRPLSRGPTDWAPELEYAYADGQSFELELPFEDGRLTQVKFALQGTFGTGAGGRWIHGWQYIGQVERGSATFRNSLLYISGYRFDGRWSMLSMAGLRQVGLRQFGPTSLLLNHSVFYDFDPETVLGLEVNLRQDIAGDDRTRALVIPQIHRRLTELTSLQAGLGVEFRTDRDAGLVAALRLIREF